MAIPGSAFFEAGLGLFLDDKLTGGLDDAARKAASFEDRMQATADRLDRVGDRYIQTGQQFAMAGGALLAPIIGAVTASADLEESMADVRKVTDLTDSQLTSLGNTLRAMDTPTATSDLAQLAAAGAQMGVATDQLEGFVEQADRVSVAFDIPAEEAGRTLGILSNIFDTPIDQMGTITDRINALSDSMAATAPDILNFTRRSGNLASTMNVSAGETAAFGASLIASGLEAERAATGFNRLLARLNNADRLTPAVAESFDALGINAGEMATLMRDDASSAMQMFLQRVSESEDPIGALTEILGQEAAPHIAGLANDTEGLAQALERMSDESFFAGSVQQEFANRTATTTGALSRLWKNVTDTASAVGDQLTPTVTRLTGRLTSMLGRVEQWVTANPKLTRQIAMATAVTGGLLTVVGGGLATIGLFAKGLSMGASALSGLIAFLKPGGVLLSSIGSTISWLTPLFSAFGSVLSTIGFGSLAVGAGIFASAGALIFKFWRPLAAFFGGFFEGLWDGMQPLVGAFGRLFGVMKPVGGWLQSAAGWVWDLLRPVGSSVSEFTGMASAGRVLGTVLMQALVTPLTLLVGWIKASIDFWSEFFSGVGTAVDRLRSWDLFGAGKALIGGFIRGIKAQASELYTTVSDLASTVREYLPFSPARRGPLSDLHKTGSAFIETMARGMTSGPLARRLSSVVGEAEAQAGGLAVSGGGRGGTRGGGGITLTLSFGDINVGEGGEARDVQQAIQQAGDQLEQRLRRILRQQHRTQF